MKDPDALDPYAPPASDLESTQERRKAALAHPGLRLAAVLLDALIFFGLAFACLVMGGLDLEDVASLDFASLIEVEFAYVFVPLGLYAILWLVLMHRHSASPGKLAFGLRIIRRDGRRAALWRIVFLRYILLAAIAASFEFVMPEALAVALSFMLTNVIDPLMIFTRHHRTLHDRVADTIVVRTR